LSLEQSGWFMGAFFWTYAIFQIPSGWIAERLGSRAALPLFAFAWSLASIGIGVAKVFWLLMAAQMVMGIAQAGVFPASCNSIGHWIPLHRRSLACGVVAAGMQVGAILAGALAGELLEPIGRRQVFIMFAMPGFVWAGVFVLFFRDRPEQVSTVNAAELEYIQAGRRKPIAAMDHPSNEFDELRWMLTRPVMWLLCGQQICRAAGYMFFASWFPTFLQETRGVSVTVSGYQQGIVLAGTLAGSLIGGLVTDWIWRRTGSLRASRAGMGTVALGGCALLILLAWFVESPNLAIALLAIGALFAAIAGPCAFASTIDIGGEKVPQIFGLMNMCGNFAAASCPVLVAAIVRWTSSWNLVLFIFFIVYLVGALCWMFIDTERDAQE
jgi:ACS family glucarate transporter-like MFS transporter/ACS family D-galactonate transporter-like MFS transporter